jgi:hypothetical protein
MINETRKNKLNAGLNLFGQSWPVEYPIKRRAQVNSTLQWKSTHSKKYHAIKP